MSDIKISLIFVVNVILTFEFALAHSKLKVTYNCTTDSPRTDKYWTGICKDGTQQSPINIDISGPIQYANINLTFINIAKPSPVIINESPSKYTVSFPKSVSYLELSHSFTGKDRFKIDHINVRWGSYLKNGSEHTISFRTSSLEFQIVAYNVKYPNYTAALGQISGVLILAVPGEVDGTCTRNRTSFPFPGRALSMCATYRDVVTSPQLFIPVKNESLICPSGYEDPFYSIYSGSLTRPPCTENIIWIVSICALPLDPLFVSGFLSQSIEKPESKGGSYFMQSSLSRSLQQPFGRRPMFFEITEYLSTPLFVPKDFNEI